MSFLRSWHFSWDLHIKEKPDIQRRGNHIGKALTRDSVECGGTERKWGWLSIMIKEMGPDMWAGARVKCKKKVNFDPQLFPFSVTLLSSPLCVSCLSVSNTFNYLLSLRKGPTLLVTTQLLHPSQPSVPREEPTRTASAPDPPTGSSVHSKWTLLLTVILLMPPIFCTCPSPSHTCP